MSKSPKYINTDLELAARFDLRGFVTSIENSRFQALHTSKTSPGKWVATLAIFALRSRPLGIDEFGRKCSTPDYLDPESCVRGMLDVIESFDQNQMSHWKRCTSKDFDIGYSGGSELPYVCQGLSSETVARIGRLGAGLKITVYPADMPVEGHLSPGGGK